MQPQASTFYWLLGSDVDDDTDVQTQPAQVREIDQEVYKYVGVGGVDQARIVQIGNALVFGEQEILTNTYTSQRADVSAVVEGIIGRHMLVQAHVASHFVAAAEEAGWSTEEIDGRLRRIAGATVIGEIRVVDTDGSVVYSSLLPPLAGGLGIGVPHADALAPLLDGSERSVELATAPRAADGEVYKYVAVAGAGSRRVVQVGIPIEGSAGNLLYAVYQREADLLVRSRNLEALWVVNLDRDLAASAPRSGQAGAGTVDAASVFGRRAEAVVAQAMDEGRVVSEASLSLLSPADRGIWVASPIINTGGIPIGGLALAVSLDDIASTVQAEAFNTTLIAFVLLGFTAAAALWGTRWLTQPIEVIASAARQVEMGKQPDEGPLEDVIKRTDELGSLARVFEAMTVQVFNREEQLEMMVSARTEELQQSNRSLRVAQRALEQDLEMAKVVQAALVREGNVDLGGFAAYARMTPAQQVGGDFVDVLEPSGGKLFFTVCDVSGKGGGGGALHGGVAGRDQRGSDPEPDRRRRRHRHRGQPPALRREPDGAVRDRCSRHRRSRAWSHAVRLRRPRAGVSRGRRRFPAAAPDDRRGGDGGARRLRVRVSRAGVASRRGALSVHGRTDRRRQPERRAVREGAARRNPRRRVVALAGGDSGSRLERDPRLFGGRTCRRRHDLPGPAPPVRLPRICGAQVGFC